jgi:hypothetical protein
MPGIEQARSMLAKEGVTPPSAGDAQSSTLSTPKRAATWQASIEYEQSSYLMVFIIDCKDNNKRARNIKLALNFL